MTRAGDNLDCGAFPPLLFFCVVAGKKAERKKSGGKAPHSKGRLIAGLHHAKEPHNYRHHSRLPEYMVLPAQGSTPRRRGR
jgi:hypothetical protein